MLIRFASNERILSGLTPLGLTSQVDAKGDRYPVAALHKKTVDGHETELPVSHQAPDGAECRDQLLS